MGSPRTKESKEKAQEEAKKGFLVFNCANCGAIGQTGVNNPRCHICLAPVTAYQGYRRRNDETVD